MLAKSQIPDQCDLEHGVLKNYYYFGNKWDGFTLCHGDYVTKGK